MATIRGVKFYGDISGKQGQLLVDCGERIPMVMVMLVIDGRGERIDCLKLWVAKGNYGFFQKDKVVKEMKTT